MFAISSKPAVDRLSRVTFKVIGALEEQLGDHLDFHRVGTVRLAETGKSRSALEALYARAQQEAFSPTFDYCILPDDMDTFTITENGHEWDALIEAEPRVSSFFPGINNARFESYVAGLSAYTPDGHFILGEIDERPGLYVAAGCCGSGVMSSGGIGEALAGLIIEGESPHNLMPFRPDRFGIVDPASTEFQMLCAKSRARKAESS